MEQFANNATTTLSVSINASVTSITVTSATPFPSTGNFRIIIDSELMLVTAVSGNNFTVTRGAESTTATNHSVGAVISQVLTSGALSQFRNETNIITGTAGETLSLTNGMCVVYQDTTNARGNGADRWYAADNAATAPVKMSRIIGVTTTAISSGSTGTIFLGGQITGSGLTAGPLYLGTSGAVTGTKPNPSAGTQAWILPIGSALSSTIMDFIPPTHFNVIAAPSPAFFQNTSTVTVETFADPVARIRKPYAIRSDNLVPDPGFPLCHYRMNEGPNSTLLIDVMGQSNCIIFGTAGASVTWSTDVPSALSSIATYSGTFTSYAFAATPSPFWTSTTSSTTFSVATWLKRTTLGTTGFGTLFSTGLPNNNIQCGITEQNYETTNGNKLAISKTGVSESLSATAITDTTTWHHVAITYDGSTVKFYVDGSLLTSNSYSTTLNFSSTPTIGGQDMKLCDFRYFNFVLSATQISHLNSGKNTDNSSMTTTTGYVGTIDATLGPCIQTYYGDTGGSNLDTKITFMNRLGTGGTILLGVSL